MECSIRRPVEKNPVCLLSLVMDAFGKTSLMPSTHSFNSSGVHFKFRKRPCCIENPSCAPPNCEKVTPPPSEFKSARTVTLLTKVTLGKFARMMCGSD